MQKIKNVYGWKTVIVSKTDQSGKRYTDINVFSDIETRIQWNLYWSIAWIVNDSTSSRFVEIIEPEWSK